LWLNVMFGSSSVIATVTDSGRQSSSAPAFMPIDPRREVSPSPRMVIEPAFASRLKLVTSAPSSTIAASPAFAPTRRRASDAPDRSIDEDAALTRRSRSSSGSVGSTTLHSWRPLPKPSTPGASDETRRASPDEVIRGSAPDAYRASTLQSEPDAVVRSSSPQLRSSRTSADAPNRPSAAERSVAEPPQPIDRPDGQPATRVPASPPTMTPARSVATRANGVRAAMTASPMMMRTSGHQRHAWRAVSSGMAPACTASATAPAVMRATPQKMRPRFTCICHAFSCSVRAPPYRSPRPRKGHADHLGMRGPRHGQTT
jgi:hypothetical protein